MEKNRSSETTFHAALFLAFFAAATSVALAHIADFDDTWKARAEEARAAALAAYNPDPEAVANSLNAKVHKYVYPSLSLSLSHCSD